MQRDIESIRSSFNSRPHKEVDSSTSSECLEGSDLSIHDLTRRSTIGQCEWAEYPTFQFTTSQGGRLASDAASMQDRPLSIHDLTRRST